MLIQGRAEIVLTESKLQDELESCGAKTILCVDCVSEFENLASDYLTSSQKSTDLAYVIYTSGSTGIPKGVMITHDNVVNTIKDINKRFAISNTDRIYSLSSLSFDLSVYDIFGSFAAGAAVVLPDSNHTKNPCAWVEQLLAQKITVWNSVPVHLQMLIEYISNYGNAYNYAKKIPLRLILLSGDWIPISLPSETKKFFKNTEIVSLGGATEASIPNQDEFAVVIT